MVSAEILQKSTRNIGFDIARGVAILLVVLGHSIQYIIPNFDENHLFRYIYSVHMPIFVFMSGYVTFRSSERPVLGPNSLAGKCHQLLVPFFFWIPISYIAISQIQCPPNFSPNFLSFIYEISRSPASGGMWFLLVLFQCHLLLAVAFHISKNHCMVVSWLILVLINTAILAAPGLNWLGFGLLRWYFMFFLLGYMSRQYSIGFKIGRMFVVAAIIFTIFGYFWSRKELPSFLLTTHPLTGSLKQLLVQLFGACTALAGIYTILSICTALATTDSKRVHSFFTFFSSYSLPIYVGHYVFLYTAVNVVKSLYIDLATSAALVFLFALTGSIAQAYFLRKFRATRRLFFGE